MKTDKPAEPNVVPLESTVQDIAEFIHCSVRQKFASATLYEMLQASVLHQAFLLSSVVDPDRRATVMRELATNLGRVTAQMVRSMDHAH